MSRLTRKLNGTDPIEYPEDVLRFKTEIPELALVPDGIVQELYREYSDQLCAGWLIIDDYTIKDFSVFLNDDEPGIYLRD